MVVVRERGRILNRKKLEFLFPKLKEKRYEITSNAATNYNCIAWAAGDSIKWWEPDQFGDWFWPEGIPREYSLDAYINAFEAIGYVTCDSGDFEVEFDKIAIYTKDDEPTHASRQIDSIFWTSKLGNYLDISHEIDGVSGYRYGDISVFMKRSKV